MTAPAARRGGRGLVGLVGLVAVQGGLGACAKDDVDDRGTCTAATCASGAFVWAAPAASLVGSTVTAVATSPGEPPWFAGSYDEQLELAGRTLTGDGGAGSIDGFAARIDARRLRSPWAAPVYAPYPVRIAGLVPDGEEGAIAIAVGREAATQVRVEAVWLGRERPVNNSATDAMPDRRATIAVMNAAVASGGVVTTVDRRGWPIVAVSGIDIRLGDVLHPGQRAVVARVGQGGVPELLLDLAGAQIDAIAAGTGDTLVIGGTYGGSPADLPACAEPTCGFVATLGASAGAAGLRWVRVVRAVDGAAVRAVGMDAAGRVMALASAVGVPIDPPIADATTAVPAYLLYLGAGGTDEIQVVLASGATVIAGGQLAVTPDGGVVVALTYRGTVQIGPAPITSDAVDPDLEGVVAELAPNPSWLWADRLRGDGSVELNALAVDGDQLAVGGHYRGSLELFGPLLPRTDVTDGNGFVLELVR